MLRDGSVPAYVIYRGVDLTTPAFRVVAKAEPAVDDFVSYLDAGSAFPSHRYFLATGVSMFTRRQEAETRARAGRLGAYIAELRLTDRNVHFTLTDEQTGHLTVWAFATLLVERVVSCVEIGRS